MSFDPSILTPEDFDLAYNFVGNGALELRQPDLEIAPDGTPYIYRWYVTPRGRKGNVYFHIQVASDPERPLHDHPWDNQSVILSGGYIEHVQDQPPWGPTQTRTVLAGDVVQRKAADAHRLELPWGVPYTITLFATGPNVRDWGFWCNNHRGRPEWRSNQECVVIENGVSVFRVPRF